MANIGHAQTRKDGSAEPPLVTIGDDLNTAAQFLEAEQLSYSAVDVVRELLSKVDSEPAPVRMQAELETATA
jgi:nitronate monooxygenase